MSNVQKIFVRLIKGLLYGVGSILLLAILLIVGLWGWRKWEYYLPSEQQVRKQFENHRIDYVRLVALLKKDPSAKYIGGDGSVNVDGVHERINQEYRGLLHAIGAKFVTVEEDGAIQVTLWGCGGAIMSDSYMGVRYFPTDHRIDTHPGWSPKVVSSLEDSKLPQEKGSVASGLYVVAIEPEWYLYRFEYQE